MADDEYYLIERDLISEYPPPPPTCRRTVWKVDKETGEEIQLNLRCKQRSCWYCAWTDAYRATCEVMEQHGDATLYELNISIRPHHQPLRDEIERLCEAATKLRGRAAWTKQITGGIACLGLGGPRTPRAKNPHLHHVVEVRSQTLERHPLQHVLAAITGDACNVYVHPLPVQPDARKDRLNYQLKPPQTSFRHDDIEMERYLHAVEGRRSSSGRRMRGRSIRWRFGNWWGQTKGEDS